MTKLLATLVASMFVAGAAYADDMKKDAAPAKDAMAKTEAKKDAMKAEGKDAMKKDTAKVEAKKDAMKADAKDAMKKDEMKK